MPVGSGPAVFHAITVRRAEVLREIADGRTLREVAAALGIERSGVRSQVERLKPLTGCENTRELGRWWREHRQEPEGCATGDHLHQEMTGTHQVTRNTARYSEGCWYVAGQPAQWPCEQAGYRWVAGEYVYRAHSDIHFLMIYVH
jgi:DNA-binding CsgD family transcriptional regulator